jgi:hypothetical protein
MSVRQAPPPLARSASVDEFGGRTWMVMFRRKTAESEASR